MADTFKRRQRVVIKSAAGNTLRMGTVLKAHVATAAQPHLAGWYVVRFDDGGALSVHGENMRPVTRLDLAQARLAKRQAAWTERFEIACHEARFGRPADFKGL